FDTANFLTSEDHDAVAVLIKRLADTQVVLHPNTRVERVERSAQGIAVHFMENGEPVILKGTHLLVATGRKPNLKSLSLQRAGVTSSDAGTQLNGQLKPPNRRIYRIGEVRGDLQYAHLPNYHAGIVISNALLRLKPDASADTIPRAASTATDPSKISMTEA